MLFRMRTDAWRLGSVEAWKLGSPEARKRGSAVDEDNLGSRRLYYRRRLDLIRLD